METVGLGLTTTRRKTEESTQNPRGSTITL